MNEEDAAKFLEGLSEQQPEPTTEIIVPRKNESAVSLPIWNIHDDDGMMISNQSIINEANDMLLDRLKHKDSSLRISDIVNMKAEAFKQNQALQGRGEDVVDVKKLIPSVINIQINNN